MAKADLGEKQTCPECTAKFYDLTKRPAICPKCGCTFDPVKDEVKIRRAREKVKTRPVSDEDDEEEDEVDVVEKDDDDEEEDDVEIAEVDVEADDIEIDDDDEDDTPGAKPVFKPGVGGDVEDEDGMSIVEDDEDLPDLDEEEIDLDEVEDVAADPHVAGEAQVRGKRVAGLPDLTVHQGDGDAESTFVQTF